MSSERDFDPLHGRWAVANRRLTDRWDPRCTTWEAFAATSVVEPALGGLGHVDRFAAGPFEGLTLRLFEPATRAWRIWWASTDRPGRLDPPMEGRFAGGTGTFEGEDVVDGRTVRLRFVWTLPPAGDGGGARWEQRWTADGGATWTTNWTMDLTPAGAA